MTSARVLVPTPVTAAAIKPGLSIPEPDASVGEVAWASGGAYVLGDERTNDGSVYRCAAAHSGRSARPADDGQYWTRLRPTNRMAPFDEYMRTRARATGSLTFVLAPGFFNGIVIRDIEGQSLSVTVRAGIVGAITSQWTSDLYEQAAGLYELLFVPLPNVTAKSFDAVEIHPDAHVTVTITSAVGLPVSVGLIMLGNWESLIGDGDFGGAQYGASSAYKSYTYRKELPDGTYELVPRTPSRDVTCTVVVDADEAVRADSLLRSILNSVVAFEASDMPRYGYLNTVGFVSGSVSADNYGMASISLSIKGNI